MKIIFVADDPWPWPEVVQNVGKDKNKSDDQVQQTIEALEGLWVSL